ncbi:MAG: tetratricopeptide repeat protein [Desulfoprunum sp.]
MLIIFCYCNTFNIPWHLDDPPNITENYPLLINNLLPETLWSTLFAKPFAEGQLYRPIANLSFALNWYFVQENPFGYHLVNLVIHILTAFFLLKTSLLLLQHSFSERLRTDRDILFIAVFSAILWAINPIQTQAVTYIVQRMASMAAMFFIFATYTYIRARQAGSFRQGLPHYLLTLVFFLLALGCKENAVTLIPSLLLVEVFFLANTTGQPARPWRLTLILANICLLAAALYYIFDQNYLASLFTPIGSRPFSLMERLLTQPSILLFYLSLLLYPSPERLSIDHSFTLSTSLLHPWTTLPAIVAVLAVIVFALWQRKKLPLLSFAILFFFVNHLVESTIIPLEMIFEHRNYLPSFFLFLPLAAGAETLLNRFRQSSRLLYGVTITSLTLLLIMIGLGTYSRNAVWATEESLWADALAKAPDNARPFAKLGEIYGWQKEKSPENLQTAVALLHKALERESPRTSFKPAIVGNIGKVYRNYGMLDEAVVYFNKSLELNPNFINSRLDLAETLALQRKFEQALKEINVVIDKNDQQSRFFNLKGMILLWMGRPDEAVAANQLALHKTLVNKQRYFYNIGVGLTRAGHYDQGMWFLRQALKGTPDDRKILYSLTENRLLAGDADSARKYSRQILDRHSITAVRADLQHLATDYTSVPIDIALISPIMIATAKETVTNLDRKTPPE